jgi:hypothetical protein
MINQQVVRSSCSLLEERESRKCKLKNTLGLVSAASEKASKTERDWEAKLTTSLRREIREIQRAIWRCEKKSSLETTIDDAFTLVQECAAEARLLGTQGGSVDSFESELGSSINLHLGKSWTRWNNRTRTLKELKAYKMQKIFERCFKIAAESKTKLAMLANQQNQIQKKLKDTVLTIAALKKSADFRRQEAATLKRSQLNILLFCIAAFTFSPV